MSDDRGVTPAEEMEMTSPQWRSHQSWAKGLRTRGGFLRQCGGRLDKTGAAPKLAWRRGWGQTGEDGAYTNQRFNLSSPGKAHGRKPRFQTGPGKSGRPGL